MSFNTSAKNTFGRKTKNSTKADIVVDPEVLPPSPLPLEIRMGQDFTDLFRKWMALSRKDSRQTTDMYLSAYKGYMSFAGKSPKLSAFDVKAAMSMDKFAAYLSN